MSSRYQHTPVLLKELLVHLKPQQNENFIDATVGGGGHAHAILKRTAPHGKVLACDLDPRAVTAAKKELQIFGDRFSVLNANYSDLNTLVSDHEFIRPIKGVILDLGLSSDQLDVSQRGFSFKDTDVLDMRFDPKSAVTASDVILNSTESKLLTMLKQYGEVRNAKKIAKALAALQHTSEKQLRTNNKGIPTQDVVRAILRVSPWRRDKIHPATQVFQALRISVNDELENLKKFLPQALNSLTIGGRVAVISYHSLEDRIVKDFFRREARSCLCPNTFPVCQCDHKAQLHLITKKVIRPSESQVRTNIRSRSARMRIAEKIEK